MCSRNQRLSTSDTRTRAYTVYPQKPPMSEGIDASEAVACHVTMHDGRRSQGCCKGETPQRVSLAHDTVSDNRHALASRAERTRVAREPGHHTPQLVRAPDAPKRIQARPLVQQVRLGVEVCCGHAGWKSRAQVPVGSRRRDRLPGVRRRGACAVVRGQGWRVGLACIGYSGGWARRGSRVAG